MKYQITSDNMSLTPSMDVLTREKFGRIENRLKDFEEDSKHTRVVLNTAPDGMFLVKAMVTVNGKEYFSDETDYTLEGALIKTVEELFNMLDREKSLERKRRSEGAGKGFEDLAEEQ
jgi:ribosome-associated translation inhibitor RaiA